jgi:hypothetical protein
MAQPGFGKAKSVCLARNRVLLLHPRRRKELSPAVAMGIKLGAERAPEFSPGWSAAAIGKRRERRKRREGMNCKHFSCGGCRSTRLLFGVLGAFGVLGVSL